MSAEDAGTWQPWHPAEAHKILHGLNIPWCIAGGWALDLWHGKQTRPHEDLEIAISRADFSVIRRHLSAFKFFTAGNGEVHPLPDNALPPDTIHQTWILEENAQAWRMDIFLEPGDSETWIYRRDETLRRKRADAVGTTLSGIPYLKPEIVLFYKAKAQRDKDEVDFNACLPHMDATARKWLKTALENFHPGHDWIKALNQTTI